MKKLALVGGLVLAASIVAAPVAFAQDPITKGVPVAQANAACAGVNGQDRPEGFDEAVKAYNTVDNTDDAAFSAIPAEWQKYIIATEDHADYLEMQGLKRASITCGGATAVFPDLVLAGDVSVAVCAHARLDLIAEPQLRDRVQKALDALGRKYGKAHKDCTPEGPEPTPTATPTPTPTPTPTSPPPPADFDCKDFATQADAQKKLDEDKSDPHNLDADTDGIACEIDEVEDPTDFTQVGEIPTAINTGRA